MRILGIVNITRDSFSDGGRYLTTENAVMQARKLVADGADLVDLGGESTHPDAENVSAAEEIARLRPVIEILRAAGIGISVDTYKPEVIRAVAALGVEFINDVTGLRDPEAVAAVRDSATRIILMHSTASNARAQRLDVRSDTIVARVVAYFERRVAELTAAGVARERLILDPGMGFFLGRDPAVSLAVLRHLDQLTELGLPLCISTSRKSFLGAIVGEGGEPRPVEQRGAATLASELWAALHGVEYIRTHDPRPLRDALVTWQSIAEAEAGR